MEQCLSPIVWFIHRPNRGFLVKSVQCSSRTCVSIQILLLPVLYKYLLQMPVSHQDPMIILSYLLMKAAWRDKLLAAVCRRMPAILHPMRRWSVSCRYRLVTSSTTPRVGTVVRLLSWNSNSPAALKRWDTCGTFTTRWRFQEHHSDPSLTGFGRLLCTVVAKYGHRRGC